MQLYWQMLKTADNIVEVPNWLTDFDAHDRFDQTLHERHRLGSRQNLAGAIVDAQAECEMANWIA